MATVSKWTPFGVALDITATGGTVTRTSATTYTVKINVSWETYYSGAQTNYGMTAASGGVTHTISAFTGAKRSSGSGSFTGTYSISGNGSATKTITVTFKNYEEDFHKKLDQSFYNNMKYTCYNSFEECDTLADKFLHRIFTIQNLLEHYVNNENDKYLKNEIKNFHTLGMVIINYFLSEDLLRYMELATRDQTTERYNNPQLFQQLSEFANFYLSETNEYNKMYNETINKKSEVKQLKKTLAKSNQE